MLGLPLLIMTCGLCVSVVTKAIKNAGPKAEVEIDLVSHRVMVATAEGHQTIELAVKEAGYAPS